MTSTSLSELTQQLLAKAEKVESLAPQSTGQVLFQLEGQSPELKKARRELLEITQEIQVRARGPADLLEQYQIQYNALSCLRWLLHFKIFTHVPADSKPIAYATLASLASVPLGRLQSVARMAMTAGLFAEPDPGHVAHSPLSLRFATDALLRDWAVFITEYGAPATQAMTEATEKWGESRALDQTAWNVFGGTTKTFFEYLKDVPGMVDLFSRYMQGQGLSEGMRLEHVLDGFDWAGLDDDAHIVDVGGSNGFVSVALAKAHPGFKFTVQDLPEAVEALSSTLADLPDAIASRVQFQAHSFFDPQPPQHPAPDVYFLRKILHDWPADRAREILSQLGEALRNRKEEKERPGSARIVIMDIILPAPGTIERTQEAMLRVRDLSMAQAFNSQERNLGDWEELFESAEPKLRLLGWKQPPGSAMAVMEVGLAE
ncbi:S-adenosyl-L-methionine-dependent methyltransferase [Daldinia caldariorum]|uniref:S-adenosyl-L-methionine-dependent methyltransferase n=1 Tax=Daldinia caldariorum TaxID=326644 RepID=UPI002008294B|nr:S-adenosyl-L-methionine-dependent methyltransferase [Daldinia caldariorum]KAI1467890.1 S-adenosyl-L-methionine-dependent methyltransferase [Daldinia caldariorum]